MIFQNLEIFFFTKMELFASLITLKINYMVKISAK